MKERCKVMGVLNVTPDSLSDGGLYHTPDLALRHAIKMKEEGADIIDIGGESTRPFSHPVSLTEELARIVPVVKTLAKANLGLLSIDTRRAEVARICLLEGVSWINDVSALSFDPEMIEVAKKADKVVLMHAQGLPATMQIEPRYDDVVTEVVGYLSSRVAFCEGSGIVRDKILVDPGLGFGKSLDHNLALQRQVERLQGLGAGVLLGPSRKAFIGALTGIKDPSLRDDGTLGALAFAVMKGVSVVRVHHVGAATAMLKVFETLLERR